MHSFLYGILHTLRHLRFELALAGYSFLLRRLQIKCGRSHNYCINAGQNHKVFNQAVFSNQNLHQRTCNEAGKAKAHNRQASCETTIIGEPLHQCRHRRNIACSQTDTADNAVKKI